MRDTNNPSGLARRSLPGFRSPHCSEVVDDGEAGSCPRSVRHLPDDHCGQAGRALCPYLPGLGVQVGQRLVGFQPRWSPSEPVGARFPIVNGLHAHAIRPFVWPALLA